MKGPDARRFDPNPVLEHKGRNTRQAPGTGEAKAVEPAADTPSPWAEAYVAPQEAPT
jgi:hypothetical protein